MGDAGNNIVSAVTTVANDFGKTLREKPLEALGRGLLAYGTAGLSELANLAIDKNIREPKRTAEGVEAKANAEAQAGIDETNRFTDAQKKQRSAQAALASRIGEKNKPNRTTILTSPLGVTDKGRTILGG